MKILCPYKDVDHRPLSSKIISGGIEKAIRNQLLLEGVEIVEIKGTDYQQTMMVDFVDRVDLVKPDLIICHYPNHYFNTTLSNLIDVPIAWVCHHTAGFAPDYKETITRMNNFVKKSKNTLWMVSEYQHEKWTELGLKAKVQGYVPSSYVDKRHVPNRRVYDAMTIGRADEAKNPFLLHQLNQGIVTVVMSNQNKTDYCKKNLNWTHPTTTMWDREYDQVMHHLQYAGVYFSTWAGETFGQTALEALARGVPVVLNGDDERKHASQTFLQTMEFGEVVIDNRFDALVKYMGLGMASRRRIADATFEKFGLDWWKQKHNYLIERSIATN